MPEGFRRIPNCRVIDAALNKNSYVSQVQRLALLRYRLAHDEDFQEYVRMKELNKQAARLPMSEWQRLLEIVMQLRDEIEASGKCKAHELMQVQACVAIVADPTTRPEDKAKACDRVYRMFEDVRGPPPDADAAEEEELKGATTLDLMRRIKGT